MEYFLPHTGTFALANDLSNSFAEHFNLIFIPVSRQTLALPGKS